MRYSIPQVSFASLFFHRQVSSIATIKRKLSTQYYQQNAKLSVASYEQGENTHVFVIAKAPSGQTIDAELLSL